MPTLEWANREGAVRAATRAPFRLLEHDPALSCGDPDNENMLIQGDNLEGVKALMPYYAGRVKCIAIDPPYNTRSAFEHYDDNMEHSTWLSMMYPRLEMMRDLLAEDGSIWICIDDNESHYLKVMMDEVFGRKNFVASVIWQKIYTVKNSARHFSDMHDYILVYAKNLDSWQRNLLPRSDELNATYSNPDNDPRGAWTTNAVQARNYYSAGSYEIRSPAGQVFLPPTGTYWRIAKATFDELDRDGRVWWGKTGSSVPRIKKFLSEVKQGVVPATIWTHTEAGQNAESKEEVRALFADQGAIFGTPKPERLFRQIITIATNPGDIVCDPFLGSGTTAAVAHKMGRRWIGIEMGDHAVTHCAPRLRKVVEGEQGGISEAVSWKGGGGFRFCRIGPAITDEEGRINSAIRFATLAAHVWFSETHTPLKKVNKSPLLGVHKGTAVYLLYNGILGDKKSNTLTGRVLRDLPKHNGQKVIFSECTSLGDDRLQQENVIFKHIPYDIKGR